MRLLKVGLIVTGLVCLGGSGRVVNASTTDIYVAQAVAGANTGMDCADARSLSSLASSDWAAGTTIHLCGTITSTVTVLASGKAGSVITVKWEPGARISQPVAQAINLNGTKGYLLFDGGSACGPTTVCNAVESMHQTSYATGQTGIIEATANGSALPNHNPTSQAFYGCDGCHDIEIRNLIIRNLYQHTSVSDATSSADSGSFAFECIAGSSSGCAGGTVSIHDSTIHDNGNAIGFSHVTVATTFNVYAIDFYHNNWAIAVTGTGQRTVNFHDNHIHDVTNWDTTADVFHHNGMHIFMTSSTDSLGINFYNNLSDGDWGNCCTTSTGIFVDTGGWTTPNNVNVYNNLAIQYPGNLAPAWEYAAHSGIFANNMALGVANTPSNTNAIVIGATSTNITLENNVIQGYGQYLYVQPGANFVVFDYNSYGPAGMSGVNKWEYETAGSDTFSGWQAVCSCDAHGQYNSNLVLSSLGTPQSGSPLIGAGANLTFLGISPLDSGTTAGGSRLPNTRPASGAWDAGAYQFASGLLSPPVNLTASPR